MKNNNNWPLPQVEKIVAASDEEYVQLLNKTARIPADSMNEYMARFSTCYEARSGIRVRFTSPEAFVADLKAAGRVSQDGSTYILYPPIAIVH